MTLIEQCKEELGRLQEEKKHLLEREQYLQKIIRSRLIVWGDLSQAIREIIAGFPRGQTFNKHTIESEMRKQYPGLVPTDRRARRSFGPLVRKIIMDFEKKRQVSAVVGRGSAASTYTKLV